MIAVLGHHIRTHTTTGTGAAGIDVLDRLVAPLRVSFGLPATVVAVGQCTAGGVADYHRHHADPPFFNTR